MNAANLARITASAYQPNMPNDTIIERSLRADLRTLLEERTLPAWLVTWWNGNDTGLSSRYLAVCLSGSTHLLQTTPAAAPSDTSDVGRCVRLLDLADDQGLPWRDDILAGIAQIPSPLWGPLLPRWGDIEAAYRADRAAQNAWKRRHPTTEERESRRVRQTDPMPPSRCWWLVSRLRGSDPYMGHVPHPFAGETP